MAWIASSRTLFFTVLRSSPTAAIMEDVCCSANTNGHRNSGCVALNPTLDKISLLSLRSLFGLRESVGVSMPDVEVLCDWEALSVISGNKAAKVW